MTLKEGNDLLTNSKDAFTTSLRDFAVKLPNLSADELKIEFGSLVNSHTQMLSCLNDVITGVHNRVDLYRNEMARDDIKASTLNVLDTSLDYWKMAHQAHLRGVPLLPVAAHSYDNIQRLLNSFVDPVVVDSYKKKLSTEGIAILDSSQKLLKARRAKRVTQSIGVGVGSVGTVLIILLAKESIPAQLATMLQILFALGCGGLSAALIGYIALDLKKSQGVSAAGGFVIFLVIFFKPPVMPYSRFDLWVSLRDSTDYRVDLQGQNLRLDVEGPDVAARIVDDEFYFSNLSSDYANEQLELILESQVWRFENARKVISIKVKKGSLKLKVIKNPELVKRELADSIVHFTASLIRFGSTDPLVSVRVRIVGTGEQDTTTDSTGSFTLRLNKHLHMDGTFRIEVLLDGFAPFPIDCSFPTSVAQSYAVELKPV
jgi:hypothetical protein